MFLAFLYLTLCVYGISAPFSYPNEARIANHTELPWHAVLLRKATVSTYGAVVASRYFLLTVCKRYGVFKDLDEGEITYSNIRVLAGSISVRPYEYQGAQVRWIYYWEDHPKCRSGGDSGYYVYDISVIKVTQCFIFNSYLRPMPFERDQQKMHEMVNQWITSAKECTFAGQYTMWDPPIDVFCAIGSGTPGNSSVMNRTGMVCTLDFGSPIECRRDSGDKRGEYLVIGHASYAGDCNINYADIPQIFVRYDWALHEWISQFSSDAVVGDHYFDADFRTPIEYCNNTIYSGPIPPEDIS